VLIRDIQALSRNDGPPAPGSRPFDIREYIVALQTAEVTAKTTRAVFDSAASPEARAALDDAIKRSTAALIEAVDRSQAAGDHLLRQLVWLIAGAGVGGAGLILFNHWLRRLAGRRQSASSSSQSDKS
jgi:hypothetical protein